MNDVHTLTVTDGIALLTIDSPPVNALGLAVRKSLHEGLLEALGLPGVRAVIIRCAGSTFFAGADITEFGKPLQEPGLAPLFDMIESADRPIIAAIHGTALGGGFELALACHYRIAVPSAFVGLPEVALGVLPGAGGTQRLPRAIGFAAALQMILSGEPVGAAQAHEAGLIDALCEEQALEADALRFALEVASRRPLPRLRDRPVDVNLDQAEVAIEAERQGKPEWFKGYKAPAAIMDACRAAVTLPFESGLAREAELFNMLEATAESAAQRHIFFAKRSAGKVAGVGREVKPRRIGTVALARGADPDRDRLARLLAARRMAPTLLPPTAAGADLAEYDLVVVDGSSRDVSGVQLAQMSALAPGATIALLGNPCLLDDLAAEIGGGANLIGVNLAPGGAAVEITPAQSASAETIATAFALARRLGLLAIYNKQGPGTIIGRAILACNRAVAALANDGVGADEIRQALSDYGFVGADLDRWSQADHSRPSTLPDRSGPITILLNAVAAECADMLAQGKVLRASDIDVALVEGAGWPPYRGGPLFDAARRAASSGRSADAGSLAPAATVP